MGKNTYNKNLLQGAVLGIALATGVPGGVLAQTYPLVVAQSAELQEAKRLMEEVNELYQQGKYREAIPLTKKALAIREKALGPDHPDVATILSNLAELYRAAGNYTEAEPLLQRSLEIKEKNQGPEHPDLAYSFNSLAMLYKARGNYSQAETIYQRALAIWEKSLGRDHPNVAVTLDNIASLYYSQERYAEAEPLLQRALSIFEEALGPEHLNVAINLTTTAAVYESQGKYREAEALYARVLEIHEKAHGEEHPQVAIALDNLAGIYYTQGKYERAEPIYQRALPLFEKLLGAEHPNFAIHLNNQAGFYQALENIPRAIELKNRALKIEEYNIALNLTTGSQRQKRQYMNTLTGFTHGNISLHLNSAPNNLQAARLALTTILQRKGRILDAVADNLQTIRDNLTPENREILEKLAIARSQIASLVFAGPGNGEPERHRAVLAALEREAEQLEVQLAAASAEFRVESQAVTIEAVQKLIPRDAVLVEMILYRPYDAQIANKEDRWGKPRYAAYILHSKGDPQWVSLGEAAPIDELVSDFRKTLGRDPERPGRIVDPQLSIEQIQAKARALDELIMRPVRSLLKKKKHILLSPDSQLNLIPFAALVDEENRFLVETHTITYLTSGRDLLKLQLPAPKLEPPVILGNPNFDSAFPTTIASTGTRGNNTRATQLTLLSYEALPGTEAEIQAIAPLLSDATILQGADATEAAVNGIQKPQILHLATHGFFVKNIASETAGGENPLLRSGLALAGFNSREESTSNFDGVLTALEVTALNLRGTQLVVMSACETGLGDVANGDGVYGLRRAFTIAGAESQLMSLWKVSDFHTQEMMVGYYQRLKDGMGRSEAMRDVQLEMLKKYEFPFYWGSFIPAGNWEPMLTINN